MTSPFTTRLRATAVDPHNRRWHYLPYDQQGHHLLDATDRVGVVLVELPAKAAQRPYHQQKLALVLANQRQFALELQARGIAVDYVVSNAPTYAEALTAPLQRHGPLAVMTPAERALRMDLLPRLQAGALIEHPHRGWLTEPAWFAELGGAPWRMDAFYRCVRRHTGVLMEPNGKPRGGRFSFDGENRLPWPGTPPAPTLPTFTPDAVTEEVVDRVRTHFAHHPGRVTPEALPTTRADAETLWAWARTHCLPLFGPYEDALSRHSRGLFHTHISSLLNLQRLSAHRVLQDTLALPLPLPSQEGFIRQILGWREFVRHVHWATDGFRTVLPSGPHTDGGFGAWRGAPWPALPGDAADAPGAPVPPAFWGTPSGLACLDDTVQAVWDDGYSHHISRLMVLSNIATLLGISPRALTDWFWVAYTDAYDWVVEPNVLGMGTFAVGELMTTKPYIAGAAYLDRMGDHCAGCAFDPRGTCPLTPMYWAYLHRHADALAHNHRMKLPLASARKRSAEQKANDLGTFERVRASLARGERLTP